jgi:hypothetical protein
MATDKYRERSLEIAGRAGLSIPQTLPLLDANLSVRRKDDAESRLFCLTATAAASYGFDKAKALNWVRQERLSASLTQMERHFLEQGEGDPHIFQTRVEGMWALAWALSLVPQMDFWEDSDNTFVTVLPNLRTGESCERLRRTAIVRPIDEIIAECDLAYCLHWAIRHAELEGIGPPAHLKPYVVVERRRAFDWLLSNDDWDAISLDT